MWKLTIKQERKSEYTNNTITEKVEFVDEDISRLTSIVLWLESLDETNKTEYKIEKAGENNGI